MSDFPTLVYKTPGEHFGPGSTTYNYRGVNEPEQMEAMLAAGWFRTLGEALAGKHDEVEDNSPPTREELETKANELNLKFDGRTSDAKLAKLIAEALEE